MEDDVTDYRLVFLRFCTSIFGAEHQFNQKCTVVSVYFTRCIFLCGGFFLENLAIKKATTIQQDTCYHCGDVCDSDPIVLEEKHFCCSGCKQVYLLLNENNL